MPLRIGETLRAQTNNGQQGTRTGNGAESAPLTLVDYEHPPNEQELQEQWNRLHGSPTEAPPPPGKK